MKKRVILFCFLMILASVISAAAADVIWTPLDEYLSHCDYLRTVQLYIAAGPDGWANAVDFPSDPAKTGKFPNGTEFIVDAICGEEGNQWVWIKNCRYPWDEEFVFPDGFIPLNELVRGYDSAAFEAAYQDELQPFEEDFDFCGQETLEVHLMPEDPRVQFSFAPSNQWVCRENDDFKTAYKVDTFYVDSDGNRWVPIKGYLSKPDGWVSIGK